MTLVGMVALHLHLLALYAPYTFLSFFPPSLLPPSFPPPSSLSFPLLPSPSPSFPLLPSPSLSFPLLPSPSLSFPLLPSPSLSFPLLPSPSLSFPRFPSLSLAFPRFPSLSLLPSFPCSFSPFLVPSLPSPCFNIPSQYLPLSTLLFFNFYKYLLFILEIDF